MKKVLMEDLKDIRFLSAPEFNPSGDCLAFVKTEADLEQNTYRSDLWLCPAKEGTPKRLTASGEVSSFVWQDDTHLLFTAVRSKEEEEKKKTKEWTFVYRIDTEGGEAERFFSIPAIAQGLQILPEDRYLFTISSDLQGKDLFRLSKKEDQEAEEKRRKEEKDYEVVEELPFWSNGAGFIAGRRRRLCLYEAKTEKITLLTKGKTSVQSCELNDSRTKALVLVSENKGVHDLESRLFILDVASGKLNDLKMKKRRYHDARFLNDDQAFVLISEGKTYGLNENAVPYLLNLNDKNLSPLAEEMDVTFGSTVNSDMRYGGSESLRVHDGWIYYVETNDTDAFLKRINPQGTIEVLYDEDGSVDGFDVSKQGRVLAVAMAPQGLQELYEIKDRKALQRSHFNDAYLKEHSLGSLRNLRIPGEGDDIVNGFVLEPVDFKKNKKYPGILVIHGGPKTVYGSPFVHEMQVWANLGYFVFFCNPKGSDGKGNAFADIRGRYGTVDFDNLMDFTDEVLKTYPELDENRLGVTGGSYGGFMTNWIIGHTDRFACAASQRSISNWISFFGTSDIGYYFANDQNASDPWNNPEKMWEHSPVRYADRCTTPTLFIHSDEDYRCWIPEALQMFTALRVHGCKARMCIFHGETHELSRSGKPIHRVRRLKEMTDWFEAHLK
ncbi:Acylamino-acid-releasing enzyme [Clostridiaceae bacterium JG1575]|nr:Acylamino-acid-releasing enzyme [Clostridiaceae bacterium JG1575]